MLYGIKVMFRLRRGVFPRSLRGDLLTHKLGRCLSFWKLLRGYSPLRLSERALIGISGEAGCLGILRSLLRLGIFGRRWRRVFRSGSGIAFGRGAFALHQGALRIKGLRGILRRHFGNLRLFSRLFGERALRIVAVKIILIVHNGHSFSFSVLTLLYN